MSKSLGFGVFIVMVSGHHILGHICLLWEFQRRYKIGLVEIRDKGGAYRLVIGMFEPVTIRKTLRLKNN